MQIHTNYSLKAYNTFGIDEEAAYFTKVTSVAELKEAVTYAKEHKLPIMTLGGGSNVLLTKKYYGLVILNEIKGIEILSDKIKEVYVKAGAGENWHEFVLFCIDNKIAGVENLSLIPGSVGAAPMQNIGAYGVEIKDVFFELEALNIESLEIEKFSSSDCAFGYRESVFKKELKGKFIISSVTFCLNREGELNTSYGAIKMHLSMAQHNEIGIKQVSDAVIKIRQSKLPDPKKIGNAGSFFKNPVVSKDVFDKLKEKYPKLVGYTQPNNRYKLAAGWLIEKAGFKGKNYGSYGVHKKQALVLVNYGDANGKDIFDLSTKVMKAVKIKFGVELEREVNVV